MSWFPEQGVCTLQLLRCLRGVPAVRGVLAAFEICSYTGGVYPDFTIGQSNSLFHAGFRPYMSL